MLATSTPQASLNAREPHTTKRFAVVDHWTVAAVMVAIFYVVVDLHIAAHRLLWFDEILTVRVERLPRLADIWRALSHSVDGMAPLYYLITRLSEGIFGQSEWAVRVPSALALALALLVTFDCAHRLTDGLHGMVALCVLGCSSLTFYGFEARSYAIYCLISALTLWIWSCTPERSRAAAVASGTVIFLGVAVHYYAVMLLVPYTLWELLHWKPWRPPSPKLIAGYIGAVLPVALLARLLATFAREYSSVYWSVPSFKLLRNIFSYDFFPEGPLLLAIIVVWLVVALRKSTVIELQPMPSAEAIGWLFLCMPLVGFVLAELKTNAFVPRYFVGALPGIAIAASCTLWRHFGKMRYVSAGVLLILGSWAFAREARIGIHPDSVVWGSVPDQYVKVEELLRQEGKRFSAFPSDSQDYGILHLEASYYAKHPERCVLLLNPDAYLHAGLGGAPKTEGPWRSSDTTFAARLELKLAEFYPMQFWSPDDLKQHALETALIVPEPSALKAAAEAGFTPVVRFEAPLKVVYLERRTPAPVQP